MLPCDEAENVLWNNAPWGISRSLTVLISHVPARAKVIAREKGAPMFSKGTRYLLAAIQAIVGYEWLISGSNKILAGTFPQGLADTLTQNLKDNPNGWYVSFLQGAVVPHSVFWAYVIEFCELGMGLALLAGAILLCGTLPKRGEKFYTLARVEVGAAAVAAFLCVLLCINFHFWMGDGFISAVNPGDPFDEGIDLDTLLPPISALICALNVRLLIWITGDAVVGQRFAALRRFLPSQDYASPPSPADAQA